MTCNPAEMVAYASSYPGVEHFPTRLPHLDRYGHAWCWCGVKNGKAVGGDAQCDECRNRPKPTHAHITYGHGVNVAVREMIAQLTVDGHAEPVKPPEQRHETVRLFEPAPTQLEGQMTF